MKKFILQWHLSEECNLKCLHCYQAEHVPMQLEWEELIKILNQYKELLNTLGMKGHINLTGGEPFCSKYFWKMLDEFEKDRDLYSFSILTNGTLIDEESAKRLASFGPQYVQLSLEGGKKTNDYVRGKGVYKQVGAAIKLLKKYHIYTSISFTATSLNYKEFPKVVKYAEKIGANNVWSDRFIPLGGAHDEEFVMSKEETQEYLRIMLNERRRLQKKKSKTNVSMYRALQFLMTHDYAYSCSAGDTLLTVMENGDLVPCRRMPIVVGNLLKDNMLELYQDNDILLDLQKKEVPDECQKCEYSYRCRRGIKMLNVCTEKRL